MALWLPIAALVAGALANNQANRRVEKERGMRSMQEMLRQKQFGEEADLRMKEALEAQSRPAVEQEQRLAEASRERKYAAASPVSMEFSANPSAPQEVKSEIASRIVDAIRRGRQQSQALASLGGRSDAQFAGNVELLRSGQDLGRIGNASRASSAILPFELDEANRKGEGWRTIADLFNTAGTMYGFYGMKTPPNQFAGRTPSSFGH